MITSQGNLYEG